MTSAVATGGYVTPFGSTEGAEILSIIKCSLCGKYNLSTNVHCTHCFKPLSGPFGVIESYTDGTQQIVDYDTGFLSYADEMAIRGKVAGYDGQITAMDVLDAGPLALLRQNRNWLCLLCGPTGTGKTWTAIKIAEMMDRHFDVDKITFSILGMVDLMDSCGKGDFVIFDEGQEWNARRSMKEQNVLMGELLGMVRFTQINFIFALPHMNMIDLNNRRLIHNYLHTIPVDRERGAKWKRDKTGVWWYNVESERIPMQGNEVKLKFRFPVIKGQDIKKVWFGKADDTLLEEYEKAKQRKWKAKLAQTKKTLAKLYGGGDGDGDPTQERRTRGPRRISASYFSTRSRSNNRDSYSLMNEILGRGG